MRLWSMMSTTVLLMLHENDDFKRQNVGLSLNRNQFEANMNWTAVVEGPNPNISGLQPRYNWVEETLTIAKSLRVIERQMSEYLKNVSEELTANKKQCVRNARTKFYARSNLRQTGISAPRTRPTNEVECDRWWLWGLVAWWQWTQTTTLTGAAPTYVRTKSGCQASDFFSITSRHEFIERVWIRWSRDAACRIKPFVRNSFNRSIERMSWSSSSRWRRCTMEWGWKSTRTCRGAIGKNTWSPWPSRPDWLHTHKLLPSS